MKPSNWRRTGAETGDAPVDARHPAQPALLAGARIARATVSGVGECRRGHGGPDAGHRAGARGAAAILPARPGLQRHGQRRGRPERLPRGPASTIKELCAGGAIGRRCQPHPVRRKAGREDVVGLAKHI